MSRAALGIAAGAFAVTAALWVLPLPLFVQSIASLVIGVAGLALLTTWRFPVGTLRASPEAGLAYLARRLRLAGLRVAEEPRRLTVRTGAFLLLRFDAIATAEGCRIRYRVDVNPVGGTGYLLLMGMVMLLVAGIPAVVLAVRLSSIEARTLSPALPRDGVLPEMPEADAVRTALVDGLSECHRLAAEADEAARAAYWDRQGLATLTGVLVGAVVLLVGVLVSPDPNAVGRAASAFPVAAVGGLAAAVPLGLLVRRRDRPRLARYREWADRLRDLRDREIADAPAPEGERGSFEVLLDASREVPDWIEARRRAGLSADLGLWSLAWIVLGYTLELAFIGWWRIGTDPLVALAGGGGSAAFGGGLYLWWRRWARRQREAAARQLAVWNERFEGLRARMERYLEDL